MIFDLINALSFLFSVIGCEITPQEEAGDSPQSSPALEMPSDDQVPKPEVSTPKQVSTPKKQPVEDLSVVREETQSQLVESTPVVCEETQELTQEPVRRIIMTIAMRVVINILLKLNWVCGL